MQTALPRQLGIALGAAYVALGFVEVSARLVSWDSWWALAFWGISLLGGGALVLAGVLLLPEQRRPGMALLVAGAVLGANATLWTVAVPLLAIAAVVTNFRAPTAAEAATTTNTSARHS